jgi:hypothetical protein
MTMLCDRPHVRFVDFWSSRFVVSADRGLNTGVVRLERGDLIPVDALDARSLRMEYELHVIELESFVREHDPDLREACARRAGLLEEPVALQPLASESKISYDAKSKRHKLKS